jgi:hypothetical protein
MVDTVVKGFLYSSPENGTSLSVYGAQGALFGRALIGANVYYFVTV